MDFTIWDVLIGIISWSIRILFWPLGFVIKYREFFGAVFPYLLLGVIVLVVGAAALGLLGSVLRGVFVCAQGIYRFFGALITAFRPSRKKEPQSGEESHAVPIDDPNDPYHVLGVPRGVSSSELSARYRELMKTNHPDRVAQLDPEIQAFANVRAKRIVAAYMEISELAKARD
jgi:hypothetical protein